MPNRKLLMRLAQTRASFYLYDESVLLAAADQLRRDFEGIGLLYSLKCNPHPRVVQSVLSRGFGADAASLAEARLGAAAGLPPENIHYSAPGKTDGDLCGALGSCTLIADSLDEVARIQRIAEQKGMIVPLGLRVNPDFTLGGERGAASKFGVDQQEALASLPRLRALSNVRIAGVHVHTRSQELSLPALERYDARLLSLAREFQRALGQPLQFFNLGSGIGIPYAAHDAPLDTRALGQTARSLLQSARKELPQTRFYLESGRFVAGPAGVYVTTVLDKKISHGQTFVILANTLNGFLRPCLAQLVTRYAADSPAPCEPLFTGPLACPVTALTEETEPETVTLVGNLCTAADVVAQNVTLPRLKRGDALVFANAGAYSAVLSPMQFASLEKPAELFLTQEGQVQLL